MNINFEFFLMLYSDYPWAGSLKPVSSKMNSRQVQREDAGSMPYKGSLRHVNQKNRRQKKEDSDGKNKKYLLTAQTRVLRMEFFYVLN